MRLPRRTVPPTGEHLAPGYRITRASPEHVSALAAIERAAAQLLAGALPPDLLEDVTDPAVLHEARMAGRLWVALRGDVPVGFALAERLDDGVHLEEIDVHPDHGRRGLGRALVRAVCDWASAQDAATITLTTFRDFPWNMPFYESLGFEEIPRSEVPPELALIVSEEAARGLDPARRVAMRYRIPQLRPVTAADAEASKAVLREAFRHDPTVGWCFFGSRPGFEERLRTYIDLGHRWHTRQGHLVHGAWVGNALVGVVYVALPEAPSPSNVSDLEAALVAGCGADAVDRFARYNLAITRAVPPGRMVTLALVGVREAFRGRGIGSRLVAWAGSLCDADPQLRGVVLDTGLERNLRFYAGLGYQKIKHVVVDDLLSYLLYRPRRPA